MNRQRQKDSTMGRFITVSVECDWRDCDVTAPEGEGTVVEKTLSIDGKQARSFLVCKKHLEDFEEIVLPLMQAGVKVEVPNGRSSRKSAGTSSVSASTSSAPSPGADDGAVHPSLICKAPNCNRHGSPLHNRTGMAQHVIRSHGYENLAAYEAEYGTVVSMPRTPKSDTVDDTVEPEPSTIT